MLLNCIVLKCVTTGNSLVVQRLGLGAFTAMAQVQSQVRKLRPHKPCHTARKIMIRYVTAWNWWFDCTKLLPVKWSESRSGVSSSLWLLGLYSPWNSLGQNTGVGSLSFLQQIFLTQELNQGLLHCRWILYQLRYQGSPKFLPSGLQVSGENPEKALSSGREKLGRWGGVSWGVCTQRTPPGFWLSPSELHFPSSGHTWSSGFS